MNAFGTVTTALGGLTVIALAGAVGLAATLLLPAGRALLRRALHGAERHVIAWAWIVSCTAMAGSLWLSEVANLPPCVLCWYQRIAMYPLVAVLAVGFLRTDAGVWRYALPLCVAGFIVSAYHVALQYRPTLDIIACEAGVPCSARLVHIFGFVSIPVMAGAAFLLIALLMATLPLLGEEAPAP